MRDRPQRVGLAVVRVHGRIYVGRTTLTHATVTVDGHRRVRWHSADGEVENRYRVCLTWRTGEVDQVRWTTDSPVVEMGGAV